MTEDTQALLQQAVERHQAGDSQTAESLYRRALESNPDHCDARYLLGTVLLQLGRFEECVELLEQVTAARPDVPDAHNNLGVAYKSQGRWEEAARAFRAAIEANPHYEQAFFNLGSLMQDRKLYAEAEKCYRHALELRPGDAHVQVNLGFVLTKQERLDEAIEVYKQILDTKPDYHQVHNSLSYIYDRQGKLDAAVASARQAIEIEPGYAEGYNNLGTALRSLGRLDEACDSFRKAIHLAGEFPLAEFNFGSTKLLQGEYLAGWPGYRRYAAASEVPPREFTQPGWDGDPIEGQKLFVYTDQGFGDTLQFLRFLTPMKERSRAEVIFECPPKLERLLIGQSGVDQLLTEGDPLPDFDRQVSLSNVAELLGVTLDSLPAEVPYVFSNCQLPIVNRQSSILKVGLSWQGNPQQAQDVVRSCPLPQFVPLADVPGVSLFSLQTGDAGLSQLAELSAALPLVDLGSHLDDFAETSAVLEQLDLLITVDTAAAHLAGALGRPVWTLLCHAPDWRWLRDRDDSPWYPTMRLFRQPEWGDWPTVIRNVAAELTRLANER